MDHRVLLLSAVRDEADTIERVAASVAAQVRLPDAWVVIDDGSTDATPAILRRLQPHLPWLEIVTLEGSGPNRATGLWEGAPARAYNGILDGPRLAGFSRVAILDGDVELSPHFIGRLLEALAADDGLGLVGGDLFETGPAGWRRVAVPDHHVHGGARMYTRACLEAVLPLPELLGWDTVDQTLARMRGFGTRCVAGADARHLRPCGAGDGALRGHARYGAAAYVGGQPASWVLLRAAKVATTRPRGVSGAAFAAGWALAAARRIPRLDDPAYRRFVRRELWQRLRRRPPQPAMRRELTAP